MIVTQALFRRTIKNMQLDQSNTNIPWYRTRWFWGVVIGLLVIMSLYLYFSNFNNPTRIGYWRFFDISIASGAALFILLGEMIGEKIGGVIFVAIYYLIFIFCIYRIFRKPATNIIYPIIILVLFLSGIISSFFLFSGF